VSTKDTLFLYPAAGDDVPPSGAKVLLLTKGGICIVGRWDFSGDFLGWHPLPGRDHEKEAHCNFQRRANNGHE
jgi:hypothetical protein